MLNMFLKWITGIAVDDLDSWYRLQIIDTV